jgi:hypothetical protein
MTTKLMISAGLACLALGVVAYQQRTLVINSKVASADVRIINGKAYAPIADIAKSLNLVVSVKGGVYELTSAGGTGQLNGLTGKTGDWLFDGGWRFRVNECRLTDTFKGEFEYYGQENVEAPEGKTLLIVNYSYRNGNKVSQPFNIGDTAIATQNGQSYKLHSNNFNFDGNITFSQPVLPGAEAKGDLIFIVPKDIQVKDLVLCVGEFAGYDSAVKPKILTVFRVGISL